MGRLGQGPGATLLLAMSDPQAAPLLLRDLTSLRLGGPPGRLVTAGSPEAIATALASIPTPDDPRSVLVLGGGTNVIIADDGFAGTVVRVAGGSITATPGDDDGVVEFAVDAGVDWDHFVATTVEHGCRGVEMMSGVPGSVGASPIQNIGAYGQQVADVIERVEVIDRSTLEPAIVTADECRFGFRTSRFKTDWNGRYVVTRVHLALAAVATSPPEPSTYVDIERAFARSGRSPVDVGERRDAVLATRRTKSMLIDPSDPNARSVGSFFINPTVDTDLARQLAEQFQTLGLNVQYLEGRNGATRSDRTRIPAAHLLRYAGFHPGDSWGPVKLSDKHVLALVANPGATATDVWMVGHAMQARVRDLTGIELHFEATFIGDYPAFDAAAFERTYSYEPGPDVEPAWLSSYRSP